MYVSPQFDIYTISPDGTDSRQIAKSQGFETVTNPSSQENQKPIFYDWPTWSPNAKSLAFSRITEDEIGELSLAFFSISMDGTPMRLLFTNPSPTNFIGPTIPHYAIWSPDSQVVSFVSLYYETLSLFFARGGNTAEQVLAGGPIYQGWSPDSRRLILHAREMHYLVSFAEKVEVKRLEYFSTAYFVPSWSAKGDLYAFVEDEASSSLLKISSVDQTKTRTVGELDQAGAFLWSPTEERLAVADGVASDTLLFQRLRLLNLRGQEETLLENAGLIAFFWSPDGKKIAYLQPIQDTSAFALTVFNLDARTHTRLLEFIPTPRLKSLMLYFDQYAPSHSLWSPNSKSLVISGMLGTGKDSAGSQSDEDHIYVIDIDQGSQPRDIAKGRVAFWSPR